MSSKAPSTTDALVKALEEAQSHVAEGAAGFLSLLHQITLSNNSRHIAQLVVNLAELLKSSPKAFYQLNPLFYPHVRVDFDVLQVPIASFVLKTSHDVPRVIIFDTHPDRLPFHGLSTTRLRDILLHGSSSNLTYEDVEAVTDTGLQGCLAQLAQNLLDEPNAHKTCRQKALALLRKPFAVPPSLLLHDLTQLGVFTYTAFSDLYSGIVGRVKVVIKKPRVICQDSVDCLEIVREIVLCRQLRHPNILPLLGANFDEQSRLCGLVTPYMTNGNITEFLKLHPNVERLTPTWQIMKGLEFLHNFDPPIAHRDVKGANVLVTDDLVCCLSDFGLSSIPDLSQRSRERTVGTLFWMAPEVQSPAEGRINLFEADIFSLGITILEIYCGAPPTSVREHFGKRMAGVDPEEELSLCLLRTCSLPLDLAELVCKMLEFTPSERLSVRMSCQALEDNLVFSKTIEGIPLRPLTSNTPEHQNIDIGFIRSFVIARIKEARKKERMLANCTNTRIARPKLTISRFRAKSPTFTNENRSHLLRQAMSHSSRPIAAASGIERVHGLHTPVTDSPPSPTIVTIPLHPIPQFPEPRTLRLKPSMPDLLTPSETPNIVQPRPTGPSRLPFKYPRDPTTFITPSRDAPDSDDPPASPSSPKRNRDSLSGDDGDDEQENLLPSISQRFWQGLGVEDIRSSSPSKRRR